MSPSVSDVFITCGMLVFMCMSKKRSLLKYVH